MTPDHLQVEPGQGVQAVIEVQNVDYLLDQYSIEIAGLEADWYCLSRSSLSIFPGQTASSAITIRPPAGNGAIAGVYEFTAKVVSGNAPARATVVSGALAVEPLYSFRHELHPERVAGVVGSYINSVHNTGNAEMTFHFQGGDPEGFCEFAFDPHPATVPPNADLDVAVTVKPGKRGLLGRPKTYNLTLTVTPEQTPEVVTLSARLDAIARLRGWYIPLAILCLLALGALAYTAYWAGFDRENATYLRKETWSVIAEPLQVDHGVLYPFEFELVSREAGEAPSPVPVKIRGDVTWPDTGEVPPSIVVVLKDPLGNCWGPRQVGRTADPFQFPIFNGGAPCKEVDFGQFLLNRDVEPLEAARYALFASDRPSDRPVNGGAGGSDAPEEAYVAPAIQYCVRNDGSVIFDGRKPRAQAAGLPPSPEAGGNWTLYLTNHHPAGEWDTLPDVTLKLKASDPETGRREKDRNFALRLLREPDRGAPPALGDFGANDNCGARWDTELKVPSGDDGIAHGTLYARRLELTPRTLAAGGESPPAECQGPDGSAVICDRPQKIIGDITWEHGQGQTATIAVVVLRDPAGNCWISVEGQTIEDEDEETPFEFDTSQGQACSEALSGRSLWYLINWFPKDSERPRPAEYDEIVPPLARFCRIEDRPRAAEVQFDQSNAIPKPDATSWATSADEWNLFIVNGNLSSGDVKAPRVTVKLKGDAAWQVRLDDTETTSAVNTTLLVKCVPKG